MAHGMGGETEIEVLRGLVEEARRERDAMRVRAEHAELAAGIGTYEWLPDTKAFVPSPGWKRIFGFAPDDEIGMGEALSRVHPADRHSALPMADGPLEPHLGYAEYRVVRPDGETRWIGRQAGLMAAEGGGPSRIVGAVRDITERKQVEERIAFQAKLLDVVGHAVIATDADGQVLYWNRAAEVIYGWRAEEALGRNVIELKAMPEDAGEAKRLLSSLQAGESWSGEIQLRRKDGSSLTAYVSDTPILDAEGRLAAIVGVSADVSDRRRAEEHMHLMVNELNHRVKNTLATVQSVITQTLRNAGTPPGVASTLTDRVIALSHAHDVLTQRQWRGAELGEIVAKAAEPYQQAGAAAQFDYHGPQVQLSPQKAIAVALALHELTTNAIKYGALSVPEGRVCLEWSLSRWQDHQELRIVWREENGPPVRPPQRTGFGTRLIQRGLPAELDGTVDVDYDPAGVVCTIRARLPREIEPPVSAKFVVAQDGESWRVRTGKVVSEAFASQRHAIAYVTRELEVLRTLGRGAAVVFERPRQSQAG